MDPFRDRTVTVDGVGQYTIPEQWRWQKRALILVEVLVLVFGGAVGVWNLTSKSPKPLPAGFVSLTVQVPPVKAAGGAAAHAGASVWFVGEPVTAANRHLSVVRTVISHTEIVRGSALAAVDSVSGGWVLDYSMDTRGSKAWCRFTMSHTHYFSPVVVGHTVVLDPQIQSAICGGNTQVAGVSETTAERMKAIINR